MLLVCIILPIIILAPALFIFVLYNRLVFLRNRCRNAFSEIDVQLKRRHDLIPNLLAAAKGYITHERGTLEAVTQSRAAAMQAGCGGTPGAMAAMQLLAGAETALAGALGRLMGVIEAYPDLKANQTMQQLMEQLTTTENRIAFARQSYNDSVMFYNTALATVPTNFVAGWFRFESLAFFGIENSGEKELPLANF